MTIKQLFPTQRPALDLNFARQKRLDSRVTFTRGSTATYVGSDGLIKTAASGEARFDHDPATGESLGLLVEESRTNYVTWSVLLDSSRSGGGNATYTYESLTSPSGAVESVFKLTATTTGSYAYGVWNQGGIAQAGRYISVWIKKGNENVINLANNNRLIWNFGTESFSGSGVSESFPSFTKYPNGWYRLSWKIATTDDTYVLIGIVSPTVGQYFYLWGMQIENSYVSSYIPTNGSTVTRSADVANLTNSGIYDTDSFTILNEPFGSAAGASTLSLVGAGETPIKRTAVYSQELTQTQINASVGKTDEFWRWRILGSSFGLPSFLTNGQVTVDWGDGTVETLTTSDHTFTDGGGYHEVGFRLDSGTYFRPFINSNANHRLKVVAVGPAPESMVLHGGYAFQGCGNLEAFDATVDATGWTELTNGWQACTSLTSFPLINTDTVTNFYGAWQNCTSLTSFPAIDASSGTAFNYCWFNNNSLTSFPLIDTSSGTSFYGTWYNCSNLTSFPLIDTSSGTDFTNAWQDCSGITSFPLIDTSSGTMFYGPWLNCSGLTSFPAIDTSSGTNFTYAWQGCSGLTSFPVIDTSNGTIFERAWLSCTSLTSFPLIDTSNGTNFNATWYGCTSLTSFPAIDTSSGTNFSSAWQNCTSLTSFPLINTSSGTNFATAWYDNNSLTSFPLIDTSSGTNFASAWEYCSSLTSFPAIDTSNATNLARTWGFCSSLTSFPLIDTSSNTNFNVTWYGNSSLTSFPSINTSSGTDFNGTWQGCSSLTSFPALNTSSGTIFTGAWQNCTSLTSFPLIDTSSGTTFISTWESCSSLTSFPLINTSSGTTFYRTWTNCNSLTSFPLIDTSNSTNFFVTWYGCNSLTSFPAIDVSNGTTFLQAWYSCSSLTTFPANFFDSWTGTPANSCFDNAWRYCTSLTATSVENILNSIDTSGQSAPASGVDITIDYNTGTGTPSIATAVTNLKSRGWTITLNGVAQ